MRALLLAAIAAVVAAGCLEPSVGQIEDGRQEDAADVRDEAVADDGSGTVADGWILKAAVGPEAPLAGFAWRLPAGAAHRSEAMDAAAVTLSVFPLDAPRDMWDVEAFALAVFVVRDGEAHPVQVTVDVPGTYEGRVGGRDLAANVSAVVADREVTFREDDLGGSDDLRLVLGARGASRSLDALLVVSPTAPFDEGHERQSLGDALEALEGRRVFRMAPAGQGNGMFAASHLEVHWPWADLDLVVRIGDVRIEEDRLDTPAGPFVTRTASASAPVQRGWSAGMGYETSNRFEGEWSLQGSAHGLALMDRSPTFGFSDDPALSLGGVVAGYPIYEFTAEGDGGVEATMEVRGLDTSDETYRLFTLATFGTPLQQLVGVPGHEGYAGWGAASRWLTVGRDILPVA